MASKVVTFPPPPDSPKMVTLPGSPPKLEIADPFESGDQIEHAGISCVRIIFAAHFFQLQEPEKIQAVIERNSHNVMMPGEIRAIVNRVAALTVGELAAVQPDHHGPLTSAGRGREHVEHQAIFVHR